MKHIGLLLACGIVIAFALRDVEAQVIVDDDFESYADTAAMQANWGLGSGTLATLTNSLGNPGQSAWHNGSASVTRWIGSSFSVTPTDAQPLVLAADLWYSGANNQRNTVGLRNGASPLFEMGFYNQGGPPAANGLALRILSFAGNENWTEVLSYTALGTGAENAQWIRLEATFTATALNLTYDLGANGSVDGTFTSIGVGYANPFVDLRFGGPSAVTSATGGFAIDNVFLAVVPEPSALALSVLGGFGLLWGVRRFRK